MLINKITTGFVIQVFDTEKNQFVSQEFTAGNSELEHQDGTPLDDDKVEDKVNGKYLPFEMVQPSVNRCAVCGEPAITKRKISINNAPKKTLPVCEIHADAADEDKKV